MGLRFSDQKQYDCFFITTTFNKFKDYGNKQGVYNILTDSLVFYSEKYKAKIAGFVFMPTHIHLLLFIEGNLLSSFMRDFKKYISQEAIKHLGIFDKKIWMDRYDKVAIVSEEVFRIKLDYIHNNPVKNGLVSQVEDWIWSSAGSYYSKSKNRIPVYKDWG